jgi:hypothetical protein
MSPLARELFTTQVIAWWVLDHRTHISVQGLNRKEGKESEHLMLYLQMPPTPFEAYIVGEREQVSRVWLKDNVQGIMIAEKKAELSSQIVREVMKVLSEEIFGGIGNEEGIPNGIFV